jgi:hypothetical protein
MTVGQSRRPKLTAAALVCLAGALLICFRPVAVAAAAARTTTPQGSALPLWGVDSASYVDQVLPATEADYGKPQFFGRYVSTNLACNGHGLTAADAHALFGSGIAVALLDFSAGCNPTNWKAATAADGTDAAMTAVHAAEAIGVPAGVGLFEDFEFNVPVSAAFVQAYTNWIAANSHYQPGFYTSSVATDVLPAICSSLSDANVARALIWASNPLYPVGRTSAANMPPFKPDEISCPKKSGVPSPPLATAWQYGRNYSGGVPIPPNVDTDEWMGTKGLWLPPVNGSFVTSQSIPYEIVGGSPLPVTSWAPFGGPQKVTPLDPKVLGYLASHPADGTAVRASDGTDYVFAGGAPLYVSDLALLGDHPPHAFIVNAGDLEQFATTGEFSHVLRYPVNGTVLEAAQTGGRYLVSDGVAQYAASPAGHAVTVDYAAILGAGGSGRYEHLARPEGFWLVSKDGTVSPAGQAVGYGSSALSAGDSAIGIASTRDGGGYWVATRDGTVESFGDASFHGDLPLSHVTVNNIVAIAPTLDGHGYWLIGSDGGEFAFGDARYHGSLPGIGVHVHDVVGMVASSAGYILVGADGGVFVFGGTYHGSLPGIHVHVSDVVGILPTGGGAGYVLVGRDGGAFVFGGGSGYHGSLPGKGVHVSDVVGLGLTGDQQGYWMAGSNGTTYGFGDAPALATPPGVEWHLPVAGIAAA